jgi:hypothetical protein
MANASKPSDWRAELGGILGGRSRLSRAEQEAKRFAEFLQGPAKPALEELAEELARHGRKASIRENPASIAITVTKAGIEEISFRVMRRSVPAGLLPYAEVRMRKGTRLVKSESTFREAGVPYTIDDVTGEEIIRAFLRHYRDMLDSEMA